MDCNDDDAEILKQVFGGSSDDEDPQLPGPPPVPSFVAWDPVGQINGLWLCRHFLSHPQQYALLSAIDAEGWFSGASNNQAMRFGNLPGWAVHLSDSIEEAVVLGNCVEGSKRDAENMSSSSSISPVLPRELLNREPLFDQLIVSSSSSISPVLPRELLNREPLFDQLIVNSYLPGEGICAHVDLSRFEDGIAIISLESPCVMHFTCVHAPPENEGMVDKPTKEEEEAIGVLLTPGSLVVMSGEARYLWKHEINRQPGFQIWQGEELVQSRRISITLRKLCSSV